MLPSQKEPSIKSVSPESGIQEMLQTSLAAERLARSNEGIPPQEQIAWLNSAFGY